MPDLTVFYSDDYVAAAHAFDTTRKSQHVAEAIQSIAKVTAPTVEFDVRRIHSRQYVKAVSTGTPKMLAESQGFQWDLGLATMAAAHTNGLVSAVDRVLGHGDMRSGSLSSGLHHASFSEGGGFCTYNGLAAAAQAALDFGADRILCLDLDAHCGGGTFDIMGDDPRFTQLDVSVSPFDQWDPSSTPFPGDHRLVLSNPSRYLADVTDVMEQVRSERWDLVIYNAGVDPVNCGVSARDVWAREAIVSAMLADQPAVFALAGGYTWGSVTMDELTELHWYTVDQWAQAVS